MAPPVREKSISDHVVPIRLHKEPITPAAKRRRLNNNVNPLCSDEHQRQQDLRRFASVQSREGYAQSQQLRHGNKAEIFGGFAQVDASCVSNNEATECCFGMVRQIYSLLDVSRLYDQSLESFLDNDSKKHSVLTSSYHRPLAFSLASAKLS